MSYTLHHKIVSRTKYATESHFNWQYGHLADFLKPYCTVSIIEGDNWELYEDDLQQAIEDLEKKAPEEVIFEGYTAESLLKIFGKWLSDHKKAVWNASLDYPQSIELDWY